MSTYKRLLSIIAASALCMGAVVACGGEQDADTRDVPTVMGGKFDVPSWIRHIPADFHCDKTLNGRFRGADSAHSYSFPGKLGYKYTFAFVGDYQSYRGAVIAIYDAETGKRVALKRSYWNSSVKIEYTAERSVKYIVAVMSWWFTATGDYTLSAKCELVAQTCKSSKDCGSGQYCKLEQCGQGSAPGTCTAVGSPICAEIYAPVCGCNGRTYGNTCEAEAAGASIAHKGQCPKLAVDTSGIEPKASLNNGPISPDIFVGGCSPFSVEQKQADGSWKSLGPTRVCVWEGYAQKIPAGGSHGEALTNLRAGETYRVVAGYSIGCQENKPLSQANCLSSHSVASAEFTLKKDVCWGAWLDQNGLCRTPADGVYDDACCNDERKTKCDTLNSDWSKAVQAARVCSLFPTFAPQCQVQVNSNLACGGCTTYINKTTAAAGLDDIKAAWSTFKCHTVPRVCPMYMCAPAKGSSCEADVSKPNVGMCQAIR